MATVSTPVITWVASLLESFTGATQSTSLTVTVNITQGWEIQIPIAIRYSNVSADAVVNAYPSNDGGATYDSAPAFSLAIPRQGSVTRQASMRLPVGQYALQLLAPGPSSQAFQVLTAMVVTAINNQ